MIGYFCQPNGVRLAAAGNLCHSPKRWNSVGYIDLVLQPAPLSQVSLSIS